MDMNTVNVTITVTVNGQTFTKAAGGGGSTNPYRLADHIASAVKTEMSNELSDPRLAWDSQSRRDR